MRSQKVVHEYLIHPSELKSLEPGRAVFKSGGRYGRLVLPGYFENVSEVFIPKTQVDPISNKSMQNVANFVEEVPF